MTTKKSIEPAGDESIGVQQSDAKKLGDAAADVDKTTREIPDKSVRKAAGLREPHGPIEKAMRAREKQQ